MPEHSLHVPGHLPFPWGHPLALTGPAAPMANAGSRAWPQTDPAQRPGLGQAGVRGCRGSAAVTRKAKGSLRATRCLPLLPCARPAAATGWERLTSPVSRGQPLPTAGSGSRCVLPPSLGSRAQGGAGLGWARGDPPEGAALRGRPQATSPAGGGAAGGTPGRGTCTARGRPWPSSPLPSPPRPGYKRLCGPGSLSQAAGAAAASPPAAMKSPAAQRPPGQGGTPSLSLLFPLPSLLSPFPSLSPAGLGSRVRVRLGADGAAAAQQGRGRTAGTWRRRWASSTRCWPSSPAPPAGAASSTASTWSA